MGNEPSCCGGMACAKCENGIAFIVSSCSLDEFGPSYLVFPALALVLTHSDTHEVPCVHSVYADKIED